VSSRGYLGAPPAPSALRSALLLAGLAGAVGLRAAAGGGHVATSTPAALLFAAALLALAGAAGWRPGAVRLRHVVAGVLGSAVLVGAWWLGAGVRLQPVADVAALAWWSPVVVAVAVAEEALLRGALFGALQEWRGPRAALVVTSVAFAVMHIPLYGVGAVPLDLAVGLWLGGLRLLSGSWTAPAVAHALADLAGGWL
jgi:membrane protease YdiL (CAAX protease family)